MPWLHRRCPSDEARLPVEVPRWNTSPDALLVPFEMKACRAFDAWQSVNRICCE
jgi:hypothetical protein